jgi:hypothetical protein
VRLFLSFQGGDLQVVDGKEQFIKDSIKIND